ncbi:MAG: hypothetical protein NTW29_08525 [Bacteroidetes bacterium]|nr:hypothetical protein [Bacteroidota bacterium]
MARSHHRKKHKEHLRQFRHSHEGASASDTPKTKAAVLFTVIGALLGFAVGYFGSSGSLVWMGAGLVAGAIAGYYLGKNIDRGKY